MKNRINRSLTHFRTASLSVVLVALLAACSEEPPRQTPGLGQHLEASPDYNILVVSFDALRADALGTYGYHRETSPHIDAFADRSVVFESAYTAAPVTPTSFAAGFTGQYPFRVFIGWKLVDTMTLAELMKNSGYATFGIFNNVQLAKERNVDQGFERFTAFSGRDEVILEDAGQLIREHAETKFFGWVHFLSPHTPYQYRAMSDHLAPAQTEGRYAKTTGGHFDVQSDEELRRVRDLYDGEVFYADDLFARLQQVLADEGLTENTIVILTADHGEEFMEHGQLQHNSMFEEVIRIPMILHHPDLTQGVRSHLPYVNIDLLPTVAALAGIHQPAAVDGVNLLEDVAHDRVRVVTGMTNKERQEILLEQAGRKLVQLCLPEFQESLYDLNSDPAEQTNLILDRPGLADELFKRLQEIVPGEPCQVIADSSRGKSPQQMLSDEQIEQLRSLGYIQ